MADHVEIDYDQMAHIGQACDQQSQEAEQMLRAIASQVDNLRAGGWIGQGADAFFAEMDDLLLPALNRLVAALQNASDVVRAIAYQFGEAEQEAARLFSGQGAAMGQAGDHVGNFNFKVEIEGATQGAAVHVEANKFKYAELDGQDVIPKVEGNPAVKYDDVVKFGGGQDFKVEGSSASAPVNKFPDMPGGGGGSTPHTNSPDVVKFPGPPAPSVPGPLGSAPDANKFAPGTSPGSQANKFTGLEDDVDDLSHKV